MKGVTSGRGVKNCLDLNKKPIFLAEDFDPEEMCLFQERSDASETPNLGSLSHFFRVFKPKRMSEKVLFSHLEIRQENIKSFLY